MPKRRRPATRPDRARGVTNASWTAGRGPLGFLPVMLFRDDSPAVTIAIGWALAALGSLAIGGLLSILVPDGAGPQLGNASGWMLFVGLAIFSPVVETLLMGGVILLLLRVMPAWGAVIASAILWGIAHSLLAPWWGAVIWWPFLIFSTLFVTFRARGLWPAFGAAAVTHMLQNGIPALLIVLKIAG